MAVGDGWQRWIMARLPDGQEMPVRFDDFDPQTMVALASSSRLDQQESFAAGGGLEDVRRRFSAVREQAAALGRQLSSEEDRCAGS